MKVVFVEIGMGVDLHGQDVTEACVRAARNAIQHNSMPGLREFLPGRDINNMRVNVKLGVPADADKVNIEKVKSVFPYGQVTVEVVPGGLLCSSGVVLPDKGDRNDLVYIVNAAVEVGYEPGDSA
ncbi:Lin0512 family protein [Effusibacillus pohliae]|uniref:Lin0512 family protein n=1 Tax=Effusibacillus pohliae TaxID=232270 RepID=UPI00037FBEF1|nr:Lin0512 family protein [Effusibacillus pohliae]